MWYVCASAVAGRAPEALGVLELELTDSWFLWTGGPGEQPELVTSELSH